MRAHFHLPIHKTQLRRQGNFYCVNIYELFISYTSEVKSHFHEKCCKFNRGPVDVLILSADRLKPIKEKSVIKTKLTPITLNESVKTSDKGKRNRTKNTTTTLDDIFDNDDGDDIQGDASGITVPISKSLGNSYYNVLTLLLIIT